MSEYTKGPWYWNRYPYDSPEGVMYEVIPDEDNVAGYQYPIADVHDFPEGWGNALANAKLIAAAPDLLEAAQQVIARWEHGDLAQAVRMLNEAIKKATGEGK